MSAARALQGGGDLLASLVHGGQVFRQMRGRILRRSSIVGGFALARQLLEELVQGVQLLFEGCGRARVVAAVVRLNARAVERHLAQADQPQIHGKTTNLPEKVFQRSVKTSAKLGNRGMVEPLALYEPHKIETVAAGFFNLATTANPSIQTVQNRGRDESRMNRGLPQLARLVFRLPRSPIHAGKHLVKKPHRIIGRDQTLKGRYGLLPPNQHWSPSLSTHNKCNAIRG